MKLARDSFPAYIRAMTFVQVSERPAEERKSAKPAIPPGSHVYLIDGSGYIFRAFHALPPLTRKSDGLPVGAVHGFCNMLWKLLRETQGRKRPTHLAVIFDAGEKTFRNEIYTEVQGAPAAAAGRPGPAVPADPRRHARLQRRLHRAGRLRGRRPHRHLCQQAVEAGGEVTIVSSDKDLMQLDRGPASTCSTP